MNRSKVTSKNSKTADSKNTKRVEIKLQESPVERALKLSSEQVIALAIQDLIKKDELN